MNKNFQIMCELSNLAILFSDMSRKMNDVEFNHFVHVHDCLEKVNGIQLIEVKKR
ncbi:hypothetical protein [Sporolactobacillus terrae]|uniref:hypothetical protein n=1 Tax=Sporolactobacillus terrae TaxID=269673 RepID=UPI000A8B62EE|nr:hypothetical protein [Sporolactobacillus terrae]